MLSNLSIRARLRSLWQSGAISVLLQQGVMRALAGIKFLLIARMLGLEAVGTIGIALLALALAEAVSDTGLWQAIVQENRRPSNTELGATWTLLILRGLGIGVILAALAPFLSRQFHVPDALPLLLGTAVVPVVRGLGPPCSAVWARDRQFSRIAIFECSLGILDFALAVTGALLGMGVYAVLGAMIASELIRSITLFIMRDSVYWPNLRLGAIRHYTLYSRWIWADSIANGVLLNQFDRIVVGKWFGPASLGVYQMTSKLSQMLLFDPPYAASLYLFPTFSSQFRRARTEAYNALRRYLVVVVIGMLLVFVYAQISAGMIINILLGPDWAGGTPIFRLALFGTALRGLGAILTAYLRATNRPRIVTQSLAAQICVLLVAVPVGGYLGGLNGVVIGLIPGALVSTAWMLFASLKPYETAGGADVRPTRMSQALGKVADN